MELKVMNLYSETENNTFKEIVKNWKPEGVEITRYDDGEKACLRIMGPSLPDGTIEELSAAHPEVRFTAHCFYDDDGHEVDQVFRIKEGEVEELGGKLSYLWCLGAIMSEIQTVPDLIELTDWNVLYHLMSNVEVVFGRIDSVFEPDGPIYARLYKPEVTVTATYENWEAKATKSGVFILSMTITKNKGDGTKEYYSPVSLLMGALEEKDDSQKIFARR